MVVAAIVIILIWLPCTLCLLHAGHCANPHNSLTRYYPYTTEEETEAQRSNLTRPQSQEVAELGFGPRLLLMCPSPSPDCTLQVCGCSQDTLTPKTEPSDSLCPPSAAWALLRGGQGVEAGGGLGQRSCTPHDTHSKNTVMPDQGQRKAQAARGSSSLLPWTLSWEQQMTPHRTC